MDEMRMREISAGDVVRISLKSLGVIARLLRLLLSHWRASRRNVRRFKRCLRASGLPQHAIEGLTAEYAKSQRLLADAVRALSGKR